MSEHWKSTPKYWCKHCSCYVRDTKLEKQNHEATARHQGALKRSLRNLHRNHEREERDKERARHEIARLNGVVSGAGTATTGSGSQFHSASATEAERKRQREQLAVLGVAIPDDFRPEMAIAGEWTVTSTRVVEEVDTGGGARTDAVATGVRKRDEPTEEQRDEEEAVQRLFKKPRKWGRDSKLVAQDEDEELDALLSGTVIPLKRNPLDDDGEATKEEQQETAGDGPATWEEDANRIKHEQDTSFGAVSGAASGAASATTPVKEEADMTTAGIAERFPPPDGSKPASAVKPDEADTVLTPVVFKKRKPKGIRTR
ncbi:hypothetical protein CDD83_7104 [Cordyceps sp. RAO-2017]|nr:hypothetical protein CDD83_7104 [Cordyceps sp. RAO-2017]